jgi:hypothetical protein
VRQAAPCTPLRRARSGRRSRPARTAKRRLAADPADHHATWDGRCGRHVGDAADHDRLGGLCGESRGSQPVGQVVGEIVAAGLPLHGLAAGAEKGGLRGDESLDVEARQIARAGDESAVLPDDPQ